MTHKNEQSRMAGNTSCVRTRKHPLGTLRLIPKAPTAPPKSAAGRTELPQMKRPDFPATPVRPRSRTETCEDPFGYVSPRVVVTAYASPLAANVVRSESDLLQSLLQNPTNGSSLEDGSSTSVIHIADISRSPSLPHRSNVVLAYRRS